ncbi:hypothetical protein Pcinc_004452 [Petrolisthes cinctipes]|uniref:Uncharacterized protein n=1 Tax=Petrolisthes cinctipes TaxID=88211 RepID=A0AAE1GGU6_PETCI|nr:hypothetical protein Pcinc_004452 [Petrolisthes cinctipes]
MYTQHHHNDNTIHLLYTKHHHHNNIIHLMYTKHHHNNDNTIIHHHSTLVHQTQQQDEHPNPVQINPGIIILPLMPSQCTQDLSHAPLTCVSANHEVT